jgi:putative hemolysin
MDASLLKNLIPLVVLLVASAYFSGSEAAIFSLSSLERDLLGRKTGPRLGYVMKLLQGSPDQILITVLTGNMFVNVFASSIGEAIGARLFSVEAQLFSIFTMTALLLVTGEMMPKNLGIRHASEFVRFSAGPLYYLLKLFAPIRWFLNLFNIVVERLFPVRDDEREDRRHDLIRSAVHIGYKEGILDKSELHLVESFVEFRDQSVEEVMIPRTEVAGVDVSTPISDLLGRADLAQMAAASSMIAIYDGDLDHIVGHLPLRDLLPYKYGLRTGERMQEVMKPALSVPSSKNCADLLVEMRSSNTELAIVVDEFGGTGGIVTIKGLVEELLGYFYPADLDSRLEVSANGYRVPGTLRIEELELLVGRKIQSDSHTLAGLILEHLQDLPEPGTRVVIAELELIVLRVTKNRVLEVEIRKGTP